VKQQIYLLPVFLFIFGSCKAQKPELKFVPADGSPYSIGGSPGEITVTDVNNDGNADLITPNSRNGDITILLGDGAGKFSVSNVKVTIGLSAHIAAAGDLNKDGNIDLAAVQHDSYDITVLLGDGKGGFSPAPNSPFPSITQEKPHNHGLIIADFSSDGMLDIAVSNHGHASVSVFLGKGDGTFSAAPGSPFECGRGPYPLAAADVNADGNVDIVTPNLLDASISVLLGDGKGDFRTADVSPVAVDARPFYIAVGDINSDKKPDIMASHDDVSTITILLGDGAGKFSKAQSLDAKGQPYKLILRDMNNDSKLDLVTNSYPRSVSVMLGDGNSGFRDIENSPIEVGSSPNGIAVGVILLNKP
jgi:hypothetical protein